MHVLWILGLLLMMSSSVNSQSSSSQDSFSSGDAVTNFQPSLAVVIGVLSILFSLTFTILIYSKFCHRPSSPDGPHDAVETLGGLRRSGSRFSGIDKTVVESLPFFRFSSLGGAREGLECSVCLSKFEDVEILRLLPKCKHAFHIDCVDRWLEKHASCPLCRHRVSADDADLSLITYSNSLQLLRKDSSELREGSSNFDLFIKREGSARFPSGRSFRSFRKIENFDLEQGGNLKTEGVDYDDDDDEEILHKFNHRIIVSSDAVLKSRWSSVSSSDLMVLKSEMITCMSSNRFTPLIDHGSSTNHDYSDKMVDGDQNDIMKIKEEMGRKREFESKIDRKIFTFPFPYDSSSSSTTPGDQNPLCLKELSSSIERRSMSEIIVHPRFPEFHEEDNSGDSSLGRNNVREERMRRVWLPITPRTVEWFTKRKGRSQDPHNTN